LYADALAERGIATIEPDSADQRRVMAAIAAVKAGTAGAVETRALSEASSALAARGAQQIVAACTELVLSLDSDAVPVIDPARLLARRVVELSNHPGDPAAP
jgi:aspartate racemase